MNKILVLFNLIVIIEAVTDQELWFEFKDLHGKQYGTLEEDKLRFDIFLENVVKIERHNDRYKKGVETYYLGLNQFADMTREEFKEKLNSESFNQPKNINERSKRDSEEDEDVPDAVDWREKGVVTEVKNQGSCAAHWAISATGALEGQLALKTSKLQALSEQQLIDCTIKYGNKGCAFGTTEIAFQYVGDNGLATETQYPVSNDNNEECYDTEVKPAVQIEDYNFFVGNENDLKKVVANIGPLSAGVEATEYWQFYAGGIFTNICPGVDLNLAVLLVGYNSITTIQNGYNVTTDYWILKNCWGKNWGEDGYINIVRNRNDQCGITDYVLYPIL